MGRLKQLFLGFDVHEYFGNPVYSFENSIFHLMRDQMPGSDCQVASDDDVKVYVILETDLPDKALVEPNDLSD
jgi:hypothetical protein